MVSVPASHKALPRHAQHKKGSSGSQHKVVRPADPYNRRRAIKPFSTRLYLKSLKVTERSEHGFKAHAIFTDIRAEACAPITKEYASSLGSHAVVVPTPPTHTGQTVMAPLSSNCPRDSGKGKVDLWVLRGNTRYHFSGGRSSSKGEFGVLRTNIVKKRCNLCTITSIGKETSFGVRVQKCFDAVLAHVLNGWPDCGS